MTFEEFRDSSRHNGPPEELNLRPTALWWDAKGDWTKAHESAQQDDGSTGAWLHAYLHRKEGDTSNATYGYRRAGESCSRKSLTEEWSEIARAAPVIANH